MLCQAIGSAPRQHQANFRYWPHRKPPERRYSAMRILSTSSLENSSCTVQCGMHPPIGVSHPSRAQTQSRSQSDASPELISIAQLSRLANLCGAPTRQPTARRGEATMIPARHDEFRPSPTIWLASKAPRSQPRVGEGGLCIMRDFALGTISSSTTVLLLYIVAASSASSG